MQENIDKELNQRLGEIFLDLLFGGKERKEFKFNKDDQHKIKLLFIKPVSKITTSCCEYVSFCYLISGNNEKELENKMVELIDKYKKFEWFYRFE